MTEIEFSVMEGNPGDANQLLPLLETFEKQHHIRVRLIGIPWNNGWTELAKFGIYGQGPDVSAIGTSWIGSLASMHILRPFTEKEVLALGGGEAFFESLWRTGYLLNNPTPWAIPWIGETYVLYYWKDALEKAGISDFEAAFKSDAALVETLEKLRKSGISHPMALNLTRQNASLHEASHWVWSAGGDFISADGRQVAFNQPAAMQGWKNYFSLQPFVSPQLLEVQGTSRDSFLARQSAIQIDGSYMAAEDILQRPESSQHLGVALTAGTAVVGGASFVIWQYSRLPKEAFELVHFLSSQPMRIPGAPHSHGLPVRREAMHMPSVENDVFHRTYMRALQEGRSYPTIRLWGSIEEKLILEISYIWNELFAHPGTDLDALLRKRLDPLAERLNIGLANR